jgi:hypothetical protein
MKGSIGVVLLSLGAILVLSSVNGVIDSYNALAAVDFQDDFLKGQLFGNSIIPIVGIGIMIGGYALYRNRH